MKRDVVVWIWSGERTGMILYDEGGDGWWLSLAGLWELGCGCGVGVSILERVQVGIMYE